MIYILFSFSPWIYMFTQTFFKKSVCLGYCNLTIKAKAFQKQLKGKKMNVIFPDKSKALN